MRTIKVILVLTMSLVEFKIRCDEVCKQDGDQCGIVIEEKCGCWNPRDIRQVPIKIVRTPPAPEKKTNYVYPY